MSRSLTKLAVLGGAVALVPTTGLCLLLVVPGLRATVPAVPGQPPADAPPQGPIQLHDMTAETGIRFVHQHGPRTWYVMEPMSAGLAVFDYDGDGNEDIYFVNGAALDGSKLDPPPENALYRNLGGWQFADVTREAGVGDRGFGLGVTVGDYDNDGHPDLYVSNFGPKTLYHNNGDGTFSDATQRAGVADGHRVGAGACFLDVDGDGNLDLFAANYVKFSPDRHVLRHLGGYPRYGGPRDFLPDSDTLYRNNGDGTFANVTGESGIGRHAGYGMGVVACDYDNDGNTDIFVCNDQMPNFLFHNDGQGKFREVGLAAGVAYNLYGEETGNMSADCADYDHDGRLDFYVTDYQAQLPMLFRNLGNGAFEDVTAKTRAGAGSLPHVKWGAGWADFDNDGQPDLFIACGHFDELIERIEPSTSFRAGNLLLRNSGSGTFVDVTAFSGDGMAVKQSGRGVAFADLDNDGDLDVVVLNFVDRPTILRNMYYERGGKNHWFQLRLRGIKTNRDGVGARVKVTAGDLTHTDEVHSGRGYQSHWGSRLHFGLGGHDRVDRIEVRWIGGGAEVIENLPADQLVVITEGGTAYR